MTHLPPIYRWDAVDDPIGTVHILHGMSDHARRYADFAAALNKAGFVVWGHDHRGHGCNPTPPVGLGHFADAEGWRLVVEDAWRVSDQLRASYPALPLILVAHSMGSFVAQALISDHGDAYRAVVLLGTDGALGLSQFVGRALAVAQRTALGGRAPGRWLTAFVFGGFNRQFAPNRTEFDWLSRETAEVDAYLADRLCGFSLTAQSWLDFIEGRGSLAAGEPLRRIPKDLPIRILAGSRDPVGRNVRGVERLISAYRRAGLRQVSSVVYENARHELLRESNRDQVVRELADWLTALCRSDERRQSAGG